MWASAPTNVSKTMFGRTILSALSNIVHHWRIRRGAVISTAACFAILLRGNCYRWERCLHAGGAVVQICRGIFVCWPQCFSTGSFCGTAVQSDPHPAPLFAHFFWQDRKSRPAERRLRCRRIQQQSGANRKMAGHPSGHFAYIAPCRPPAAAGRSSVARRPRRCAGMRRRRRTAAVRSSSDEACPSPISSCASSSADTPS